MNPKSNMLLDKDSPTAIYHQLKEIIKREIRSSRLLAGSRVPPEREICRTYNVSRSTAIRAFKELVDEGVLYREQGRGTFVANSEVDVNRTQLLGVGLYDPQYLLVPFFSSIMAGVAEVARAEDYQVQLVMTKGPNGDNGTHLYSRMLEQNKVDGLVVIDHAVSDSEIVDLHDHGVPIVLFDRVVPGQDYCSVLVDNRGGAFQLVEHLAELGHTDIGFVAGNLSHPPIRERYEGFRSALQVRGLEFHPEWIVEYQPRPGQWTFESELSRIVALAERPTALICHDDYAALRATHILSTLGCRVPRDFSITGFDNIPQSEFAMPELTTVDSRLTDLGREMARMLLMQIHGKELAGRLFVGRAQVIARASTAAPSSLK